MLVERCTYLLIDGKREPMTTDLRKRVLEENAGMADEALRVLAFAFKDVSTNDVSDIKRIENDLTLIGLCGMIDPPRDEAKMAVDDCKNAGIKPVMITGDHAATAKAIAMQLGILDMGDQVLTGEELNTMSDEALDDACEHVSVYARVAPEHKVRIVKAFQKKGKVVAMTGDGVNDAPALKNSEYWRWDGNHRNRCFKGCSRYGID